MWRSAWIFLLGACAPQPAPKPVVTPAPKQAPDVAPPAAALRVHVGSDAKKENVVHVELDFQGALARATRLVHRPSHAVTMTDARASSAGVPVSSTQTENAIAILPDEKRSALHVQYTVTFHEEVGVAGAPSSESIELQMAGEDLFALPEATPDEPRVPITLSIRTGGIRTGGASSFALGQDESFTARPSDLRSGFYFGGDVGTAQFHASDGDDVTAWLGHTAFDPRWIAAEVAATRAAVDVYVGRQHAAAAPPLSLLVAPTKRDDPPVVIMPRARGYLVSVDRRAVWDAPARILVAQALAQRYVGGFVSVDPRESEQSHFWSDGFARAIGREVVFDVGMIEPIDRAAEVNQLLAALTFAEEPRRKLVARGALVATALDAMLRKENSSLRHFVREIMTEAATKKIDEIPYSEFAARLRGLAGAAEIPLPSDLLGKCWRLEKKQLVPFELGFVATAEQEMVVRSVVPKSRAEAAGLRADDVIEKIDYRAGHPDIPVKMTIRRGEQAIPITYSPAGAAKPGRVYTRVGGIPDDRC